MKAKNKLEKELKGLRRSFFVAFRGIKSCILTERNMRIHLTVTTFVLLFSPFYDFSRTEYCLLALAIGSVIGMEIINTSIETIIDMCAPAYSPAAKAAKDLAAGGVLVSALAAATIGILLFWDMEAFYRIYSFFAAYPLAIAGVAALLVTGLVFIFEKK